MKFGVFLDNLGSNQLATETVAILNTLLQTNQKICPTVFYKTIEVPRIKCRFLSTTHDRLYTFDGHVITTSLDTTFITLNSRTVTAVTFYVADLEWTHNIGNYISNTGIYLNPNVKLVVPSQEYAVAIENYCGRKPDKIMNLNQLYGLLAEKGTL